MKKKIRMALIAVLSVIFIVSMGAVLRNLWDTWREEESRVEAEDLAGLPDLSRLPVPAVSAPQPENSGGQTADPETGGDPQPTESEAPEEDGEEILVRSLLDMDLSALRDVNGDVLGWFVIPGTEISYPLVQGSDNDYYLDHSWKREYSSLGSIFMDDESAADLSDFNTLIYGHRMRSGAMFGALRSYASTNFWTSAPYIYIADSECVRRYDIFAAYEVPVTGKTYEQSFSSTQAKQEFINYCVRRSVFNAGVVPGTEDCILTLSTCSGGTYATRWIVQGVLRETFLPETEADT